MMMRRSHDEKGWLGVLMFGTSMGKLAGCIFSLIDGQEMSILWA